MTTVQSGTDQERSATRKRVDAFASDALAALRAVIVEHEMTYAEYGAVKQWLIDLGEAGEWPLFLDVWVESTVEAIASRQRAGSKGAILGPFYLPGQVELACPARLPRREGEKGTPLVLRGQVRSTTGGGLGEAVLEVWQADAEGLYSGFAPGVPAGNLRAVVHPDPEGRFEIDTILPAPYEIPKDGPCGALVAAAGWSAFRPAHLHLLVHAPGYQPLTTQLFFAGGAHLDDDVAGAVKPELVLPARSRPDGGLDASYDFLLPPA